MKFIFKIRNSGEELNVKKINAVIDINATFSAAEKKALSGGTRDSALLNEGA